MHYHFKHVYLVIGVIFGVCIIGAIVLQLINNRRNIAVIPSGSPIGQIVYNGKTFQPSQLNMGLGNQVTVVFINNSNQPLSIQSGTKNTPQGVSYSPLNIQNIPPHNISSPYVMTFDREGVYPYHNTSNVNQSGTILVIKQ